jgi:hypothetical protein
MYSDAANNTGGNRRNMPCRIEGMREPVLYVAMARHV